MQIDRLHRSHNGNSPRAFVTRTLTLAALFIVASLPLTAFAQARWITDSQAVAADGSRTPISLQFRRELELSAKPRSFRVHVSADNRFVLYVNNQRVGAGPARGNLKHWRYETFDLAPFLSSGSNVIAA